MSLAVAAPESISLELPDCVLSRRSLEIFSEEGYRKAGLVLTEIDRSAPWWNADALLYAEKHNLRSFLESARADLHRSTIRSYVEVARLFAPADRNPNLSFTHHAAIWYVLGPDATVAEARRWLGLAAKNDWTTGELREAMRTQQRSEERDPGPMRGVVRITDFVKISRWSATVKAGELPETEANEIREATGSLFKFLLDLHGKPFGKELEIKEAVV